MMYQVQYIAELYETCCALKLQTVHDILLELNLIMMFCNFSSDNEGSRQFTSI